ncbi:hypothetical protein [Polycladidibacter stylochi]|uniref:hypothetical protein n=1 Tax=Polycladidibacter stylochi TaxID=1807766 RepID=UPI00082DB86F|nr:hypothetical protein [Pseudovibrio stylochi]
MIKDQFTPSGLDEEVEEIEVTDADIRRLALGFIQEAFEEGMSHGLDSAALSHAALFTAMMDLVTQFGEEAVTKFAEELPMRVQRGDYSIERCVH